jgi:archaemetzincin
MERGGCSRRDPAARRLSVELLPLEKTATPWLPGIAAGLERSIGCAPSLLDDSLDLSFALLPSRGQFSSTAILGRLRALYFAVEGQEAPGAAAPPAPAAAADCATGRPPRSPDRVLLAVTDADLCVPVFTFVFGEAIDNGPCAIISGHRLRQEFYGLPADPGLLEERLLKMATHELGHTQGLRHCPVYRCVMATSYAIERVDLKSSEFCETCAARFFASQAAGSRP